MCHSRGRARPARGLARPPFNGQLPLTPRAGHARPLPRGCHRLPGWADVGGLARRGGIHAARDVCGGGNSAGRIYAAPTNRSEKWRLRLVCRGGIYASRAPLRRRKHPGRDKSLPYALPANNRLHGGASGTPPPTEACPQTAARRYAPGRALRGCERGATVERSETGERTMFAPAGQTTARAGQLCWLAALVVRRQAPGPYNAPQKRRLFCLCLRAQTPQYLLFIISYLLFAPFVV